MTTKTGPTYYPRLGNPIHEVKSWSKVRSMIRALRRGDELPPVYTVGEPGNCTMLTGTHRAAASEIRSLIDGGRAYDDLTVINVEDALALMSDDDRDEFYSAWDVHPEDAVNDLLIPRL